jgi:16S rRNA (guanine527-N7)-methyltransferase
MTDAAPPYDPALMAVLDHSRELGFLGPGDVGRHLAHALSYLPLLPGVSVVLDLGSGGGVPGLVLARELRDVRVVLLDAMEKRCRFLTAAAEELQLGNVEVRLGRAEVLARDEDLRGVFDAVVARSFAPPPVTAECAAGFLRVGGRLVVSEPPDADPAARWPEEPLRVLGLVPVHVDSNAAATLQVLEQEHPCPEQYPRRVGLPAKRPLY